MRMSFVQKKEIIYEGSIMVTFTNVVTPDPQNSDYKKLFGFLQFCILIEPNKIFPKPSRNPSDLQKSWKCEG